MEIYRGVLKIQLPLASSEEKPDALAYNHDKSVMFSYPAAKVKHLFRQGQNKIYVKAIYEKGRLTVLRVLVDLGW